MTDYGLVDVFAGCGGLTAGFLLHDHPVRFLPVGAVEADVDAAATYAANFGDDHVFVGDVAEWLRSGVPSADVVVGGPPCQGFSRLGTRDPRDPRNRLWRKYVDVVACAGPSYFVLENVPAFLKSGQFEGLRRSTHRSGRLSGYRLEWAVLDASRYGTPQSRRRAVVVGRRYGLPAVLDRLAEKPGGTVAEAFAGLSIQIAEDAISFPDRTTDFRGHIRPGPFSGTELHVTRAYEDISLRRFAMIPVGGNRFDLPPELQAPCWRRHRRGSTDVMGRLRWDEPAVTIRTEFFKPEKGRYLHPEEPRAITHLEAARLQGFPDDFRWCGTKTSVARQIGNAVPVPLAAAIAAAIAEAVRSRGGERAA